MSSDDVKMTETNVDKLDELTNKVNRCNKNIKLIYELLQKMNETKEKKSPSSYMTPNSAKYKNKRAVYLQKLNSKEIKQPKESTLQYYKIDYNEDTEMYS